MKTEMMKADYPLLSLDNVVVTPRIGMYSEEVINAMNMICAENIAACLFGGELRNQEV